MTQTKFTPGPWVRVHDHPNPDTRLGMASIRPASKATRYSCDIAALFLCNYPEKEIADEQRANADLIAAAPELYEALWEVFSSLSQGDDRADDAWADLNGTQVQMIIDALAKARGES